ncbi:MAG: VTT domain-containing protein [Acidobacteriota bacterium]
MREKSPTSPGLKKNLSSSLIRRLIFAGQVVFVLIILLLWLLWTPLRTSRNLWVLFFYSFPSEFLIALVPHEPVILYFAKFYSPLTVAAVAAVGTLLTEFLNYSVFSYVADWSPVQNAMKKKTVSRIVSLFNRSPFLALWIAGLTPVPFYPFRFLAVMASYLRWKYLLAILTSRTPRFFILAWFGHQFHIPDLLLAGLFLVLIISINYPFLLRLFKKKKTS